ncbi:MAG: deoxyribose-phosphate aldolase [Defluviitaleaceae bacterium]|nr:deoxyribose-phosphate aldolase [Defluviitaleaceae bacterium]
MNYKKYTIEELKKFIDHTNLKANITLKDIEKLVDEAIEYGFGAVCVNSVHVAFVKKLLEEKNNLDVKICTTVGFPLGQTKLKTKLFETKLAIEQGANEIDYVINITEVKENNWEYIKKEMQKIVSVCNETNVVSKVIFENAYLTNDEIIQICKIAKEIKPTFVKTSTGMTDGATVENVKLMYEICNPNVSVKASGGIRDAKKFWEMINVGATRIGTSSSVTIINELEKI